jgi:hypothetical protein
MVANFGGPQGLLGGFLAAYFTLLLFCLCASIVQGSVLLYVGLASLACSCVIFFGCFLRINYRYQRECLKDVSLDKRALSGRRSQER